MPCAPNVCTLIRYVMPVIRLWKKTSDARFASPHTRLEASDSKAVYWPWAEMEGLKLLSSPSSPVEETLTRIVSSSARRPLDIDR